ncbi:MAG: glutathione S-transferase family protein [Erythrobacter sp.]|uniref:glutathione S-transferase family protein n=1 Tax=Erythrobacter sp. TaxID=1042 RepID=UPI0026329A97|nr:glutathione S-transferase family protein [Erythrobacter sp.]MDJ0977949.1 glutathione S-transferase family protein [Erythrobacter sp.]
MSDTPILYTCAGSRGLRCTWAAEEVGLDIDLRILPFPPRFAAPDYLKINPLGTVPLFIDELGDDLTPYQSRMTESCAIAHYIGARRGPTPFIVQVGECDYAEYLDFTYHADATLTFPQTVYMRFSVFEKDKGWGEAGEAYAKWFYKRLIKIEERLEERDYLCADRFTIADICVGYALILAGKVGLDEGIPDSLRAYRERLTARDAYKRAVAREEAALKALERPN